MIVKRVPNPRTPSPKAARVGNLLDYIEAGAEEKVELRFAIGDFMTESSQGQRAEMMALAIEAKRSKNPIDHWLFSWKAGEQPSGADCRGAVEVLKKRVGMLVDHQAICVLHRNTENLPLHVVLNRTDPHTFRVAEKGWSIDRAHQALAEIVQRQGWQPEAHALYGVGRDALRQNREGSQPGTKARDFENATGAKSAERRAIEDVPRLLRAACTWNDVHSSLAAKGLRFEQKGSGALIWVGDTAVKASTVGREFSRKRLEERFGLFEPAREENASRAGGQVSEPLRDSLGGQWAAYRGTLDTLAVEISEAQRGLLTLQRQARIEQLADFRAERDELYSGGKWAGASLNVARSLLAADQAKRKVGLSSQHKVERDALSRRFGMQFTYEGFLRAGGQNQLADLWRYRGHSSDVAFICGHGEEDLIRRDIRDFDARLEETSGKYQTFIGYYARAQPEVLSFADRGKRIDIFEHSDPATVLAALQLGAQKWGLLTVSGTVEFQLVCAELAAEHGLRIANSPSSLQTSGIGKDSRKIDSHSFPSTSYEVHRQDILKGLEVRSPSRLDWMVALRLRVTGHDQEAIAKILLTHVRPERLIEGRDWERYAQRTAEAVFGPRGDRESGLLHSRAESWLRLEGRESAKPLAQASTYGMKHPAQSRQDLGIGE